MRESRGKVESVASQGREEENRHVGRKPAGRLIQGYFQADRIAQGKTSPCLNSCGSGDEGPVKQA